MGIANREERGVGIGVPLHASEAPIRRLCFQRMGRYLPRHRQRKAIDQDLALADSDPSGQTAKGHRQNRGRVGVHELAYPDTHTYTGPRMDTDAEADTRTLPLLHPL